MERTSLKPPSFCLPALIVKNGNSEHFWNPATFLVKHNNITLYVYRTLPFIILVLEFLLLLNPSSKIKLLYHDGKFLSDRKIIII